MATRKKVPFFTKLDPELREALRRYKTVVGVPEAEQIDRALRDWFKRKEAEMLYAQKAAWSGWMDDVRLAKNRSSIPTIPAAVCQALAGRAVSELTKKEEAVLAQTARSLGWEPDLNFLRAHLSVSRGTKTKRS